MRRGRSAVGGVLIVWALLLILASVAGATTTLALKQVASVFPASLVSDGERYVMYSSVGLPTGVRVLDTKTGTWRVLAPTCSALSATPRPGSADVLAICATTLPSPVTYRVLNVATRRSTEVPVSAGTRLWQIGRRWLYGDQTDGDGVYRDVYIRRDAGQIQTYATHNPVDPGRDLNAASLPLLDPITFSVAGVVGRPFTSDQLPVRSITLPRRSGHQRTVIRCHPYCAAVTYSAGVTSWTESQRARAYVARTGKTYTWRFPRDLHPDPDYQIGVKHTSNTIVVAARYMHGTTPRTAVLTAPIPNRR